MDLMDMQSVDISYFNYTKRTGGFRMSDGDRPMTILDLTFCIEGEMRYLYNGKKIVLRPGDGILIPPGSYRERYETDIPTKYASINLIFKRDMVFEVSGYLPGVVNSNVLYFLDLIKKDYMTVSSKRNEKCLASFLYIYNRICETVCNTENHHVMAVKQFISDNLSENLSLEVIANHVHLAPQYICALFKKETGMTLTRFILKARVDHAKMLMIATNAPILDIAESCGFSDYCYFSHSFKQVTGVSARQFRSENTK